MKWHERFVQQGAWTKDLRTYLFERAGMETARRVLEVGCGTGVLLSDLATGAATYGIDLEPGPLVEAHRHAPQAILTRANAMWLPYASGTFDITFCHFLLLWVRNPLQALHEMKRVTRPGGSILALAEPDYNARIDEPDALAVLGRWQTESLQRQGADPGLGGHLANLFYQAGIPLIETGALQPDKAPMLVPSDRDLEWAVLEADLAGLVPAEEMQRLKRLDKTAWARGTRRFYVPTYFAWGQVPQMV
ncbi:MAG: methyltransferase domain-containing protein [Anaerolineales bacterium]